MANAVYPEFKEALLQAAANSALTGTGVTGLYAVLVDTAAYTYSNTHTFYTSLAGLPAPEQEILSVTTDNGIVGGDNVTFPLVSAGASCEAIVLFRKNAGVNSTWRLVCYLDSNVSGLPVTPNGGDITINWNAAGIFGL